MMDDISEGSTGREEVAATKPAGEYMSQADRDFRPVTARPVRHLVSRIRLTFHPSITAGVQPT